MSNEISTDTLKYWQTLMIFSTNQLFIFHSLSLYDDDDDDDCDDWYQFKIIKRNESKVSVFFILDWNEKWSHTWIETITFSFQHCI